MAFVTAGYIGAAVAHLVLAGLFLIGWRKHVLASRLLVAALATVFWASVAAVAAGSEVASIRWVFATEMVRDGAWLIVLVSLARASLPKAASLAIHAAWITLLAFALTWPLWPRFGLLSDTALLAYSRSGLLIALIALVLLEQIYRNAPASAQRALLYLLIGVGSFFAYDLFLFAQTEFLRGIDRNAWAVRGFAAALAAPFIAVAIRRSPDWQLDIFVSRHVVFYSSMFVAIGSYLLLMAVGGYYLRAIGGTWGTVAQLFFFVGAGIVLATIVLSESLRRRFMVFISKHFYRNKYDYRIEWLRFIQTLSSEGGADIRRTSVRAIAQILSSPCGAVYTADESGRAFRLSAVWPRPPSQGSCPDTVGRDEDLVRFLIHKEWVVDVDEYRTAPDRYQNIAMPEWLIASNEWRIVSPLFEHNTLVGFVLLAPPPPPFELTYEDRDLLKTVGRHVATYLAQQEASAKLAESRQFEAYSRLVAFMMHDLKNSAAQLSLIVTNAPRHKHNPEFVDDAIDTIANATDRIMRLIDLLQSGSSDESGRRASLRTAVEKAAERCRLRQPVPRVIVPERDLFAVAHPERLTMVIEHAIRNAQDATGSGGNVTVELADGAGQATIRIQDTGCGMTSEFIRDRLFRPFDSTKGSKGMGIGAYQVRDYVRQLGGDVDVSSSTASGATGTSFFIRLPLAGESRSDATRGELHDALASTAATTKSERVA